MADPTEEVKPVHSPPSPETLAAQAMRFLDTIEREIQDGHGQAWAAVLTRAAMLIQPLANGQLGVSERKETSQVSESLENSQIEHVYRDLQHRLIEVRRSVARHIAAEKQLEVQLQRTMEQSDVWLHKASMAEQLKQFDVSEQATLRKAEYDKAASQLNEQIGQQQRQASALREKLTDLERKVEDTYKLKQNLLTRGEAIRSAVIANSESR